MRHQRASTVWTFAAIPFLLLSSSQEAGIVTVVNPDGSGERVVYARAATGRAPEVARYLRAAQAAGEQVGRQREADGGLVKAWRWSSPANLGKMGEISVTSFGVVQQPLSMYTRHTWEEKVDFDRGDATDIEVQGQAQAEMTYVVLMPGTVMSQNPPAKVEGNRIEWTVRAKDGPQTFRAESRTLRWGYIALWAYVLLFIVVKVGAVLPRVLRRLPRKPRKI